MLRGLKRLNRYENRILKIVKSGGKLIRLKQFGFSGKTKEGFRFPIHVIEIGKTEAISKKPAGMIAGVHGLETIGIRVLLDFLEYLIHDKSDIISDLKSGKFGIVCIPILNPGGVALKRRSNPHGVDLMRNSGIEAVKAPFFFGGHKISNKLPYYRGNVLEPESRILTRFVREYFFHIKNSIMPVVDIHSGFGSTDHVWWPYAGMQEECEDTPLYEKMSRHLLDKKNHTAYKYGPQSESYTTHGDLWDRLYNKHIHDRKENPEMKKSRFLPLTLEIGTWSDLKQNPLKIFRKRGIFNPARENKQESIISHRKFLGDLMKIAATKLSDWE